MTPFKIPLKKDEFDFDNLGLDVKTLRDSQNALPSNTLLSNTLPSNTLLFVEDL